MQPQQEKENLILKYLTYAFLGVLVLVVIIITYTENRSSVVEPYPENVTVPSISLLSEQEFQFEKQKLVDFNQRIETSNETDVAINNQPNITQTGGMKVIETTIPSGAITENPDPTNNDVVEVKKVKEIMPDGTVIFETKTVSREEYNQSKTPPSDEEIKAISDTGEKTFMFLEGTIHEIDYVNNYIVFMQDNGKGLATSKYDNKTNFLVNGKPFSPNELNEGDKISVEGYGYHGVTHVLDTKTVIFKGITFISL
ncbi:MAG: hypothetical protein R3B60_03460 [Candidatus Paceibacterota bacterium]